MPVIGSTVAVSVSFGKVIASKPLVVCPRRRDLLATVGALVGVADHAVAHLDARAAAVEGELAVADVAVVDRHVLAGQFGRRQHLAAGRHEVVGDVDRVGHVHGRRRLHAVRRVGARAGRRAADLDRQAVRQVRLPGQVAEVVLAVVAAEGQAIDEGLGAWHVAEEGVLVRARLAGHGFQRALVVGAGRVADNAPEVVLRLVTM